jgi:hypothetical protein
MKLILALCLFVSLNAHALDLREYFPENATIKLTKANGAESTRYTFDKAPIGYLNLYNAYLKLNKPGYHYTWKKEYKQGSLWCAKTVGILFMGDDQSITEVGDWMARGGDGCTPNTVFGYRTLNTNIPTGLSWAGGIVETNTISQDTIGGPFQLNGYQAFSKAGIIEELPTYTPPYGRLNGVWAAGNGTTYNDVVHIVMYHGTKNASSSQVRCGHIAPISANGAYYQSYKNYNSYAIELWLAKGVGIIQENTPFIEDASYWGGAFPNCSGGVFSEQYVWSKFIDQ